MKMGYEFAASLDWTLIGWKEKARIELAKVKVKFRKALEDFFRNLSRGYFKIFGLLYRNERLYNSQLEAITICKNCTYR